MRIASCCGCCSLQNGSIIIGILSLVSGFFSLISLSIFAARIEYVSNNPDFRMGMYFVAKAVIAAFISYVLLMLIITFFFIMGAVKKQASYVFPFLCINFANIISTVAVVIGYVTYSWIFPDIPPIFGVFLILISGFCLTLQTYLWLVIFHFYKELVAEQYGHSLDNGGKIYQQKYPYGV
ncbi:lysosomal-associated transmembrane protein 4B-like [Chelonus insularis]|uniref:lysosomal-associated transmembrane protein 4B-like n=1 Tax=Chelonus insularis TaxID=460826 RepID=UPI00158A925E|nr:lysosomal-associated transmembrane protein 4B-like [Chelonus insularis]XP_034940475.1 lysosomal-associated transmembrane protein 4B-like [Chelonus insularis]